MLDDIVYTKQPMDKIKTVFHRGYEICIYPDEQPMENPNDWANDEIFLIHDHRDLSVAPAHMEPRDALEIYRHLNEGHKTYPIGNDEYWIIPAYAYIHSGISLYLSKRDANRIEPTGFDTSFRGFVLVNSSFGKLSKFEDAFEVATEFIRGWNQYLNGEIYGYSTTIGSCWGYYGDEGMKQAIEEAKSEIDSVVDGKNKERLKRLKKYIKSKVPIEYRKLEPVV